MTIMNAIDCYYLTSLFFYMLLSSEALVFFVPDNSEQILAEGHTINITCVYQGDAIPSDDVQIKRLIPIIREGVECEGKWCVYLDGCKSLTIAPVYFYHCRNGQDLKGFDVIRKGSTSAPWNRTTTGLKRNASCEDDGDYTCSYGQEEKKHQHISVIRVEYFSAVMSHSGEDAVLKCEPRGCSGASDFKKEVSWSRDGKSLMEEEKYNIRSGSLVIKKADYSDLGPYQCKIILYHGEEDKDKLIFPILNVDLTGPPKVTIEGNKDIYVCENDRVRILCKTEGYPKPDVVWHARLENASEETPNLPEGNQLTIETFKSTHEGNYTCIATSPMFPHVEVKDSVRILLDAKGHCGLVAEGSNFGVIIGSAAGATICILVIIVGIIVYCKRKGFCKHSDEEPEICFEQRQILYQDSKRLPQLGSQKFHSNSSPPDNEENTLMKEGYVQLQMKSSNNPFSLYDEHCYKQMTFL